MNADEILAIAILVVLIVVTTVVVVNEKAKRPLRQVQVNHYYVA